MMIMLKKNIALLLIVAIGFCLSVDAHAQDESTFVSVAPDALILLDVTGSMAWNPAGENEVYGSSSCEPDTTNCAGSGCTGGYCSSSKTNCSTNCSRIEIAKRAIFGILDDDNNGTINAQDSNSLAVRIGYMTFGDNDTAGDYSSGNIRLRREISPMGSTGTGTAYQLTYCGNSTSCTISSSCGTSPCVVNQGASGGTPLTNALKEATSYLDAHKDKDKAAKECRSKFVILISDGADTYYCGGNGAECQSHMYKRRRSVVAAAKQLADAGYKIFVIGFGASMPAYLSNTLNWMAYYGGTDAPDVNSGNASDYSLPLGCDSEADPAVTAPCCIMATNPTACFPSGISECSTDATTATADCFSGGSGVPTGHFQAASNDPGYLPLSGYAFLASNTNELTTALRVAMAEIRSATYSFTKASIQAIRTVDENFMYVATFTPLMTPNNDSFWPGYLKRYQINPDGSIATGADWDAGGILSGRSAATRNVYTLKSGSVTAFNTSNITVADLGITGGTAATRETQRLLTINFIRGGEQSGSNAGWKLGDIFHSNPITVGTPSSFFYDSIDQGAPKAFETFRAANPRSTANGKRLIVAGANLGQFHVFRAANAGDGGGEELWSFVPPNVLHRLSPIAHATHPTSCTHQYFVDGPTSVYDVWLGSGSGTAKSSADWKTLLVMSEGRGGMSKVWSGSSSCDSDFSDYYSAATSNYCGYYAFDVTDTIASTPVYKWRVGGASALSQTAGSHLGQPWSKMTLDRVVVSGNEKWIGMMGGGYSGTDCRTGGTCDTRGKGFYVVDVSDGSVLWTYTHSGPGDVVDGDMDYDLAGSPALIDYDNDGFIDTAYAADIGGNVWRFKFCLKTNGASCTTGSWTGGKLFASASGNIRPIYTRPLVSRDKSGNVWVYFGTGDATDPTAPNAQEKFYAVKDVDRNSTYTLSNLKNITTGTYSPTDTQNGWYINITGGGEKILGDPSMYYGMLFFTSYTPSNATNVCEKAGDAKVYAVDYITGGGLWTGGARAETFGVGVPSGIQGTFGPDGTLGLYGVTSGGSGNTDPPGPKQIDLPPGFEQPNMTNLQYWLDRRVQ